MRQAFAKPSLVRPLSPAYAKPARWLVQPQPTTQTQLLPARLRCHASPLWLALPHDVKSLTAATQHRREAQATTCVPTAMSLCTEYEQAKLWLLGNDADSPGMRPS